MNEYPTVIVGINLRDVRNICIEFAKNNPTCNIERKGQAKCKITSNSKEYWVIHKCYYEEWCKGRTYYIDGKLYHSGYELKGE